MKPTLDSDFIVSLGEVMSALPKGTWSLRFLLVLAHIAQSPGISTVDLAERSKLSLEGAGRCARRLREAGMVFTDRDPNNGCHAIYDLTKQGRIVIEQSFRISKRTK